MKVTIDRFESGYAVCQKEDGTMMDIKRINIPSRAEEGTVLNVEGETITIDLESTKKITQEIKKQADKLWED